jgi:hypothetical protein
MIARRILAKIKMENIFNNQELKAIKEIKNERAVWSYNQTILDLQHLSCNVFNWTEEEYYKAYSLVFS